MQEAVHVHEGNVVLGPWKRDLGQTENHSGIGPILFVDHSTDLSGMVKGEFLGCVLNELANSHWAGHEQKLLLGVVGAGDGDFNRPHMEQESRRAKLP